MLLGITKNFLDQIHDLIINQRVPRENDSGKDNFLLIIEKNTTSEKDESYECSCYITRIQKQLITTK